MNSDSDIPRINSDILIDDDDVPVCDGVSGDSPCGKYANAPSYALMILIDEDATDKDIMLAELKERGLGVKKNEHNRSILFEL